MTDPNPARPELIEGEPQQVALEFSEEALELFPTRLIHRRFRGVDGLNARLRKLILAREAAGGGQERSNIGGWHSDNDFFHWGAPEIAVLVELFRATVRAYVALELSGTKAGVPESFEVGLEGWANVARAGAYVAPHVHPRANFALVYYVDAGDPAPEGSNAGMLELLDPRNRVQMVGGPGTDERDAFRLRPAAGSLVAFPAWMYHYVHPYTGVRPRISIACNAIVRALAKRGA